MSQHGSVPRADSQRALDSGGQHLWPSSPGVFMVRAPGAGGDPAPRYRWTLGVSRHQSTQRLATVTERGRQDHWPSSATAPH